MKTQEGKETEKMTGDLYENITKERDEKDDRRF